MSWQRTLRRLIPYAIASGLLIGLQHSPLVETSNLLVYDLAISVRNRADDDNEEPLAWPVTVVGINEADLKRYGWPLDDRLLCSALQRINDLGARAIGLDLYRDQAQSCLQHEIQRNPYRFHFNEADGIAAIGTPARQQAFNDLVMDADRVVRRDLVHVGGRGGGDPTLGSGSRHGDPRPGTGPGAAAGGHWLMEQSAAETRFRRLPNHAGGVSRLSQPLLGSLEENVTAEQIRNRVALIVDGPILRDLFEIPHSRFAQGSQFFEVPGVELHAQRFEALQRLLQNKKPELIAARVGNAHC